MEVREEEDVWVEVAVRVEVLVAIAEREELDVRVEVREDVEDRVCVLERVDVFVEIGVNVDIAPTAARSRGSMPYSKGVVDTIQGVRSRTPSRRRLTILLSSADRILRHLLSVPSFRI